MTGLDEGAPLFVQIAERLADDIADGVLGEGERVPSTNELAAFYRINPATAAKGAGMLTDDGLLEKRRGIGMFVAAGAQARLLSERRKRFSDRFVEPLVAEARLGIDADELVATDPRIRLRRERHQAMTPAISVAGLSRRYRGQLALDNVSFDVEPGSITGLLGRNGAGKTTLMRIIAGQEFASAGSVAVLGASPVRGRTRAEPDGVRPRGPGLSDHAVQQVPGRFPGPARAAGGRPGFARTGTRRWPRRWPQISAAAGRGVKQLSRGMRSALGIVIGLAARAEVTLFDEPYAGLDPVARQLFYDRLLADYAEHPRTVLLSTHLIDEAAGLLERVIVIDQGKLLLHAAADEVRGSATSVSGPAIGVAEFTAGRTIWDRRRVGSRESAVMAGPLDETDLVRARALRLHLEPLTLQQVVVHAAGNPENYARERTSA